VQKPMYTDCIQTVERKEVSHLLPAQTTFSTKSDQRPCSQLPFAFYQNISIPKWKNEANAAARSESRPTIRLKYRTNDNNKAIEK
jgi:hypothetical protein